MQVKDTGKGSSREEAQQQAAEKVNIVIIVFTIIVIMITNNPFLILGIFSFTPLSLSSIQLKSTHQVLMNLQARARGRKTSTMISRLHTRRISLEVRKGLFTYYVSQNQGFLDPPSPLRQQWSAFGLLPLPPSSAMVSFWLTPPPPSSG